MSEHLKLALEALRPFAEAANKWESTVSDSYPIQGTDPVYCDLTVGDLRRAAEAMQLSRPPKPVCSVWKSLTKTGNCRDCGHPKEAHSHDPNS